jgi:hypothetical protein
MNSTKLIATAAFTGLLAIAGGASAAGSSHDAYHNAFFGDSGDRTNVQAAMPAKSMTAARSTTADGHGAYNQAFLGKSLGTPQVMTTGKAAYGIGSSSADGHAAYSDVFHGD